MNKKKKRILREIMKEASKARPWGWKIKTKDGNNKKSIVNLSHCRKKDAIVKEGAA